jgi:hypothetical protein
LIGAKSISVIHNLHNKIVITLNKAGEEGKAFYTALLYTFEPIQDGAFISSVKFG